jgi:hypothetical protein
MMIHISLKWAVFIAATIGFALWTIAVTRKRKGKINAVGLEMFYAIIPAIFYMLFLISWLILFK